MSRLSRTALAGFADAFLDEKATRVGCDLTDATDLASAGDLVTARDAASHGRRTSGPRWEMNEMEVRQHE
jgi:hypothetical protein